MDNKKIPSRLREVLERFNQENLRYNLFKCEHIFAGKNKNLDILFENDKDYHLAAELLEKEGFFCYMSESVEKYKKMYVQVKNNVLTAVHLHREIAWHGIKALDKSLVFKRENKVNDLVVVPSAEDALMIHVAHIIFENFRIKPHAVDLIQNNLSQPLDWKYLNRVLIKEGWKEGFYHVLTQFKKKKQPKKIQLYQLIIKKLLLQPTAWLSVLIKILKSVLKKTNPRRKGCLVAFIGVNGSGKTTMTKNVLTTYKPISDFFNGQKGYYFGWEPFLPTTKVISQMLKEKNKKTFTVQEGKKAITKKPSFLQEIIFIYNYFEYLARYLFRVYPDLRKNKLVVTDRYFYDLYGQYHYAPKSMILPLLLTIYPRPDYLYVLDTDIKTLTKRDKNTEIYSKIKKDSERISRPVEDLLAQKERYLQLSKFFKVNIISTEKELSKNVKFVVGKTWRRLAL